MNNKEDKNQTQPDAKKIEALRDRILETFVGYNTQEICGAIGGAMISMAMCVESKNPSMGIEVYMDKWYDEVKRLTRESVTEMRKQNQVNDKILN